jgi:hypothetical protein
MQGSPFAHERDKLNIIPQVNTLTCGIYFEEKIIKRKFEMEENKMAMCNFCKRNMSETKGCDHIPIIINGKEYEPIKVGAKGDFYENEKNANCTDCGSKYGNYHHPGCDYEKCPVCGLQLISCGCLDDEKD